MWNCTLTQSVSVYWQALVEIIKATQFSIQKIQTRTKQKHSLRLTDEEKRTLSILSKWVASHREHDATCSNGSKFMFGNDSPHFPQFTWTSVSYLLTLPCMSLRSATQTRGKMWLACSVKQAEATCLYYSLLRRTCVLLRPAVLCYAKSKFYHFVPADAKLLWAKAHKKKQHIQLSDHCLSLCRITTPEDSNPPPSDQQPKICRKVEVWGKMEEVSRASTM